MRLSDPERGLAIEYGDLLAKKLGRKEAAQVRRTFVLRHDAGDPEPSAAHLLQHPGPDAVRLKLELSLLLAAGAEGKSSAFDTRPKFSTEAPAPDYARLLGLSDPDLGGARRIREALKSLRQDRFIDKPPGSSTVTLLREDRPSHIDPTYSPPGEKGPGKSQYFPIPRTLWSRGWLAELSGSELFCLLAIMALGRTKSEDERIEAYILPSIRESRLSVSEETLHKGLRGLVDMKLVDERYKSRRNAYSTQSSKFRVFTLDLRRLSKSPRR